MTTARSLFRKDPNHSCFLEAQDLNSCGPCCGPVCEPVCCAPKARARDAIRMKPREVERSFMLTELGCGPERIPMVVNRISMTLRRRGFCNELVCVAPSSTSLEGSVSFAWPDVFLNAEPGQYEGDVYINGCEVGTVLLVKPPAGAIIQTDGVLQADHPCVGCGECLQSCRCGPGCAEVPDLIEPLAPATDTSCGSCATC